MYVWIQLLPPYIGDVRTVCALRLTNKALSSKMTGNCAKQLPLGAFDLEQYMNICGAITHNSTIYICQSLHFPGELTCGEQKLALRGSNVVLGLKQLRNYQYQGLCQTRQISASTLYEGREAVGLDTSRLDLQTWDSKIWISKHFSEKQTYKSIDINIIGIIELLQFTLQHEYAHVICDFATKWFRCLVDSSFAKFHLVLTVEKILDERWRGVFSVFTNAFTLTVQNLGCCWFETCHFPNLTILILELGTDHYIFDLATICGIYKNAPNLQNVVLITPTNYTWSQVVIEAEIKKTCELILDVRFCKST